MKKTTKIATLITALAIALILTGCSGSAGGNSSTDSNTSTNQSTSTDPLSGHSYKLTSRIEGNTTYTMSGNTIMSSTNGGTPTAVASTASNYNSLVADFNSTATFSNGTVTWASTAPAPSATYTGTYTVNGNTLTHVISGITQTFNTTDNWASMTIISATMTQTYTRQ